VAVGFRRSNRREHRLNAEDPISSVDKVPPGVGVPSASEHWAPDWGTGGSMLSLSHSQSQCLVEQRDKLDAPDTDSFILMKPPVITLIVGIIPQMNLAASICSTAQDIEEETT
jgi:hypothetical protein